jgi:hypothetical protein
LEKIQERNVVAVCSRSYSSSSLAAGVLKHLDVQISDGELSFPETVVPKPNEGRYSNWNVNGREIVRRDLPKETRYNLIESPNWGDSYYGTHTVHLPYKRFPRDFVTPSFTRLRIRCHNATAGLDNYVLTFEVDRVLDRDSTTFDSELLVCLNLLQENIGCCGVQPSGASIADYLQTLQVSWEVIPPGTREDAVARLFRGRVPTDEERYEVEERYDFLMSLNPARLVYGASGLERYFGASINENLVVFENIRYGNAIYIMFENWRELSQRSRTELLSGRFGQNFERVLHNSGWKETVKEIIKKRQEG